MGVTVTAPVEVGTRGTVGSLLKKEIDYFRGLELEQCKSCAKAQRRAVEFGSSSGDGGRNSRPGFGIWVMAWRRKKGRNSNGFLPGVCSAVEVAESHRMNGIPRFSYRNLKADTESCQL